MLEISFDAFLDCAASCQQVRLPPSRDIFHISWLLPILPKPLEPWLAHAAGAGALHIGNGTGLRRAIPNGVFVPWRYCFKGAGGRGGEALCRHAGDAQRHMALVNHFPFALGAQHGAYRITRRSRYTREQKR